LELIETLRPVGGSTILLGAGSNKARQAENDNPRN
jgi:hypothetical protein